MALRIGSVGLRLEASGTDLGWLAASAAHVAVAVGWNGKEPLVDWPSFARESSSAGD